VRYRLGGAASRRRGPRPRRPVAGPQENRCFSFTVTQVTGPACSSPTGFCASLVCTGDLAGTSTFTGSTITQTVDTSTTGVVPVTGDNVIQTKVGGSVITKDALVLRLTGNGDFAEVDTVVSGTGPWAGAVGAIRAVGTFADGSGPISARSAEGDPCV
jgi:hypothetical protein